MTVCEIELEFMTLQHNFFRVQLYDTIFFFFQFRNLLKRDGFNFDGLYAVGGYELIRTDGISVEIK